MKISNIEAYPVIMSFRKEHFKRWGYGYQTATHHLVVKVFTDEGVVGFGEAVGNPFNGSNMPTQGMMLDLIKTCLGPALLGEDPLRIRHIHEKMNEAMEGYGTVKAALDMAIYDIVGKKLGVPVYNLIGGNSFGKTEFHAGHDLPTRVGYVEEPEVMAEKAGECVHKLGYRSYEFKLGLPGEPVEREIQRIRLISEAVGPGIPLRIDPNASWSLEKAMRILNAVKDDCTFWDVHQPVPAWDVEGLALLTRMFPSVPIVADESAFEGYFEEVIRRRAVNAIALKPFCVGGFYPALQMIGTCERVGIRVYMNGYIESNLSVTARAHISLMLGPKSSAGVFDSTFLKLEPPYLVKQGGESRL